MSKLFDLLNSIITKVNKAVRYSDAQSLTDEQKAQARTNIGAVSVDEVPIATNDVAGVVKPASKTDEMTQPVGVDENGALFTVPPGGSGVSIDDTLTISGAAADAKATGDQIRALSDEIANLPGGSGSGDMQKSVYDPNNRAKDMFKYADDAAKLAVTNHALSNTAHSDIRDLITGLTDRLNALADSDDTTLDQLSEIVAYIKSNKSLIDAITTEKVSVSDIIDNLTTSASNKPLSAAQGVALKALIDGITIPEKLPNPNALTFSGAVTGSYDGSRPLTVNIPSGGSGTDISLGVTGATVGQIAKITAVDDNGVPTAWEAIDFQSGGGVSSDTCFYSKETLAEGTIAAGNAQYTFTNTGLSWSDILSQWKVFYVEVYSTEKNQFVIHGFNKNIKPYFTGKENSFYNSFAFRSEGKGSNSVAFWRSYSTYAGGFWGDYSPGGNECEPKHTEYFNNVYNVAELGLLYIRNYGAATTIDVQWRVVGLIKWEE